MTTSQSTAIVTPKTGKPQSTVSAIFRWHSLKTRVTLTTLSIFVIGICSLAFYTSYRRSLFSDQCFAETLLAAIFLTLLAGGLTWWMLKHQLAPIFTTIKTLTDMANIDQPPQLLPITRQDEIGEMIGSFNHLLETLRQREEAHRYAKQDWEQTFGSVPDLISIIDTNHNIIRVNRAMADRCGFGLTSEELIGRKCHELMHGTHDLHVSCPHVKMIQDGFGHFEQIEEKRWNRVYDITVSPLYNSEGQLTACVHVARDITERKKAEEERQVLEAQFQQTQKLESLGVLASGIAHDFNNILTVILGHCYLIDGDLDPETDHKSRVKKIENAANRAAELCHQMLSYGGKNALIQTRVNLWLMVDENIKMLTSALKKNVGMELDLKYSVPEINGDSAQIQQVVMNLIINAAEAIGDNNGTIKIALKKAIIPDNQVETDVLGNPIPSGSYAYMEVADNGCGMDAETQKKIFEPFFTTKFTGRGLGMSAVLGIIKSHEGAMQLSSTPGVGTTFKVYFPSYDKSNVVETAQTAESGPLPKASGTILLVEDEESIRIIGSALLKAIGFSVITATNGREALDIYRERGSGIDLVLLDLLMPEMGGFETYRILREISHSIPVVICSGCNAAEILEEIGDDEHAAVIQKPYNPGQLRKTLMGLID